MTDLAEIVIASDEIVDFFKKDLQYKEVCQKVLSLRIITQAAQERGITVTLEEIQTEADRQRREKRYAA